LGGANRCGVENPAGHPLWEPVEASLVSVSPLAAVRWANLDQTRFLFIV